MSNTIVKEICENEIGLQHTAFWANIRLEQTAGTSRFNVKVCRSPVQNRAAAQAGCSLSDCFSS